MATRSREVETVADRMFTWWSDSTRVTSDSSRVRSSASTWICTRKTLPALGAHSTSTMRSGSRAVHHIAAVGPVHRYAAAAGDEADDGVARNGRAAPGELDPDVVDALTTTPGSPVRGLRAWSAGSPRRGPPRPPPRRRATGRAAARRSAPRHAPRRPPRTARRRPGSASPWRA